MHTSPPTVWRQALLLAVISLVARLLLIPFSGVMPQDAYYYLYSRHMALSYFDHPAGVAVMIKFGTALFGHSPFAIKLTALLMSLATCFVVYRLALHFLEKQKALLFTAVFFCTPMVWILGWVVSPDVPLLFFWSLSVLFIYKADTNGKLRDWLLAGLFTGLAFCSKYTAVFILPGLLLYLLGQPDRWRRIFSVNSLGYLAVFALATLPVIIWNAQNDWASISFQTTQRASGSGLSFRPLNTLALLIIQLFLLLPWLFYNFLHRSVRKQKNRKSYFLFCFSFPMFLFFVFVSFFYWVKLNWLMPAAVTGSLLAFESFSYKQVRLHMVTSILLLALAAIQIIWYPIPVKSHDTWWGWKEVAKETAVLKKETGADFIFAINDYKTSAILRLYLREPVYSRNLIGGNGLQFEYIGEDPALLGGRDALLVDNINSLEATATNGEMKRVEKYFSKLTLVKTITIQNKFGQPSRMVKYYYCENYTASGVF